MDGFEVPFSRYTYRPMHVGISAVTIFVTYLEIAKQVRVLGGSPPVTLPVN